MDSLSQFALGSAIGVAVMGRRTAVWKAALWGGICGMLPDLDVVIDFGGSLVGIFLVVLVNSVVGDSIQSSKNKT